MLRKMLTTVAVVIVGLFGLAGVATATPSYQPPANLAVGVAEDDAVVGVNEDFTFFGQGFLQGETIIVTTTYLGPSALRRTAALEQAAPEPIYTTAGEGGIFSTDLGLDQVGFWRITATGQTSGYSESVIVYVSAGGTDDNSPQTTTVPAGGLAGSGGSDSGGLAYTGQGSDGTAGGGLAYTGTSVAGPIAIGAAALLAGLTLLFFGTRGVIRRKGSGPAST